ncbi:hypothetical protein AAH979_38670 [Plantactinospora sp. ZYX-F-223]|uniref:hypothetical protein n=1 Tax=Plantactinospora sp. ZYX-F-223 TaxID=3144103 RepID=UPI0031FD8D13
MHQGGADPVAADVVRLGAGDRPGDFAGLRGVGEDAAVAVGATVADGSCAGAPLVADAATDTDRPPSDDPHPAATNEAPPASTATANAIFRMRTPPSPLIAAAV